MCLARSGWEIQPRLQYYGDGECFIFRSMPELQAHRLALALALALSSAPLA